MLTVRRGAKHQVAWGMGYGSAKQALLELILDHFAAARSRRTELMDDPAYIDQVLSQGAAAARQIAADVLKRARQAVGL